MTGVLEWLLQLDEIRLGRDAPLSLHWQPPLAGWALAALVVAILLLVAVSYRRESGTALRRILLASLRMIVVAVAVAIICRPELTLERTRVRRGTVALLLDDSQSMDRRETYQDRVLADAVVRGADLHDAAAPSGFSRFDLLRKALLRDQAEALRVLAAVNRVRLLTFSGDVRPLFTVDGGDDIRDAVTALDRCRPAGSSTNVAGAIKKVLKRLADGPLAAVVLASDGRSTESADLAGAIDLARQLGTPIVVVPIGSPRPARDVVVDQVAADDNVYVGDLMAVRVTIRATGLRETTETTVRLIEEIAAGRSDNAPGRRADGAPPSERPSGTVVAEAVVVLTGTNESTPSTGAVVELRTRPRRAGPVRYRVEVEPLPGEFELGNNVGRVDVRVSDEPLRVLYVEGYPRYEYRYLKNAFIREKSIRLSCLLLSADPDFAQEGTDPIRRFPVTPRELEQYDVVLFGDVDPRGEWLTDGQAHMLVDFVGDHGGGFGLIAGERHAPGDFRGSVLERLIPVRVDRQFSGRYASTILSAFTTRLTAEGRHSRLFRTDLAKTADQDTDVLLPPVYWIARTAGPRPGAEVLAEHPTMVAEDGSALMPVTVVGRYGAGRVLFQAVDETWRWRHELGELGFDAFWVQVARLLAPPWDAGGRPPIVLTTDRGSYAFGEVVLVHAEIKDSTLLAAIGRETSVTAQDVRGVPLARVLLTRLGEEGGGGVFEGSFVPRRPESYVLRLNEAIPSALARAPATSFRVAPADRENRRPEADHDMLKRLADETGGRVVALDEMVDAFGEIPDRSVRIPDDISEPLWDSRLALMLFVTLITLEWSLRKLCGML